MIKRYFIKISFNGKNYFGWQIQKNAISVQALVNDALSKILRQDITVTGAGRTDTGVHAREYYAHFDSYDISEKFTSEDLIYKLNSFLPKDISVIDIINVKADANARFDAISRTYCYYISLKKNPFNIDFAYSVYSKIDINRMNKACDILMEYTDFSCFSKSRTQTKTNNCKIFSANWNCNGEILVFSITADRFLRNMVRAITGTMLDIGYGKTSINKFRSIIEGKNRSDAGYSVPANGLFLEKIEYPKEIFLPVSTSHRNNNPC